MLSAIDFVSRKIANGCANGYRNVVEVSVRKYTQLRSVKKRVVLLMRKSE